jgi:hypothetical protein
MCFAGIIIILIGSEIYRRNRLSIHEPEGYQKINYNMGSMGDLVTPSVPAKG